MLTPIGFVLLLAACGARSELIGPHLAPDAGLDAGSDAPSDAPRVDCRSDRECDDHVVCTTDRCTAGLCVHTPDNARCDDGLFCTSGDRCDPARGCVSETRDCSDNIACTAESCDNFTHSCVHAPDDRLCPISHRCDPMRGCIARALATDRSQLYEIELPSVVVRPIGRTGAVITDLALAPDRSLYGIGANQLYGIDSRTGHATPLIAVQGDFTALDAAPDGTLFAGASANLYRIDPMTGVVTTVGSYPSGFEASGDLAAYEDRLLASARQVFNGIDSLVAFDVATGSSHVVGSIGFACVYGLAAFGRTLYGITCAGQVLQIDADTGAGVELASASVHFYGATAR